jgi:prepilin-type N-terminal cleavage/methylation domain-containing protein
MPDSVRRLLRAAGRRYAALRSRARLEESGFTLIEMLMAVTLLTFGAIATIGVFSSSKKVSVVAQRQEVAVHQAQRELERLRSLPYDKIGLVAKPAIADRLESNPNKVGYYVDAGTTDGSSFTVRSLGAQPALVEHLALPDSDPAEGGTFGVDPAPTAFNVGGSGISGTIYRYVTWRDEPCGIDSAAQQICPGYTNTKRLIVAVTVTNTGNRAGLTKPIWVSSVVMDPESEPNES